MKFGQVLEIEIPTRDGLIVSSEIQCQGERTCWGIAGGEVREEEEVRTIPVPTGPPPATGAVSKPEVNFHPSPFRPELRAFRL